MTDVKAIAWKGAWPARGISESVAGAGPLLPLQVSIKSPMRRAAVPRKANILPADDENRKEDPSQNRAETLAGTEKQDGAPDREHPLRKALLLVAKR